jgi:hypothetical protein
MTLSHSPLPGLLTLAVADPGRAQRAWVLAWRLIVAAEAARGSTVRNVHANLRDE